jgi:hypothetical protein
VLLSIVAGEVKRREERRCGDSFHFHFLALDRRHNDSKTRIREEVNVW